MKIMKLLFGVAVLLLLFTGCSTENKVDHIDQGNQVNNPKDNSSMDFDQGTEENQFLAEVLEVTDNLMVTPYKESWVAKSSDKIYVSVGKANIIDFNQKNIQLDQIKVGDIILIDFNGIVEETYPARISASSIELLEWDKLLEGYMTLIKEIYQEDEALNDGNEMIAFDTTGWIWENELQKPMLFLKLSTLYGLDIVEGTYQDFVDQGLIDGENLYFENGVLIEIKNLEYNAKKLQLEGEISKWKSGLGAICWTFKGKWKKSSWHFTRSVQWIS